MKAIGKLTGKVAACKVDVGRDLLDAVEELRAEAGITHGQVEMIGALRRAVLGYYDQQKREYKNIEINRPVEIVSGIGNISLRDGKPFAHIHLCVSDEEGRCFGGHLMPGTEVFAGEIFIREIEVDPPLKREYDDATGLYLWTK
ncbi:MAG TPA: DNA-binding protein [Clostridia bacterium]|nr:DNA-binding protein [Clostridia bacterium]